MTKKSTTSSLSLTKIHHVWRNSPRVAVGRKKIKKYWQTLQQSTVAKSIIDTSLYLATDPDHDNDASRKVLGKQSKSPENLAKLHSGNAAIYIGKIYREKIWKAIFYQGALALEPDPKIYNERFLAASLDYAFKNTAPGDKVRFIVCPVLSQLFNGSSDIANAFDLSEEKRCIKKVASQFFPQQARGLELVSVDELPDNLSLFQRLRENIDPLTGVVDVKKAYHIEEFANSETMLSDDPSALEIAQFLYFAAQNSPELSKELAAMRPKRVIDEKYSEASKYYGLTEIAIRLRAILSGQYIHGGVERQAKYDQFIIKILQSKGGKMTPLLPLSRLFNGKSFETIHLNTKFNFYEHQFQKTLRASRLLIIATLINCGILGAKYLQHEFGEHSCQIQTNQLSADEITSTKTSK